MVGTGTSSFGGFETQRATGRVGFVGPEPGDEAVSGRAVRAKGFVLATHVEKDVRMIERRLCADTLEFPHADFDGFNAGTVVEMRNGVIGHIRLANDFYRFYGLDNNGVVAA